MVLKTELEPFPPEELVGFPPEPPLPTVTVYAVEGVTANPVAAL
jgi:hypothetical protein